MLAAVDRAVALLSWLAAAVLVVMLLAGPSVIAHDKAGPKTASYAPGGGAAPAPAGGAKLFADNCGSCHTLAAASTTGSVGPKLDGLALSADGVAAIVASGAGVMPSFKGRLSTAQIAELAGFVADSSK